VTGVLWAYFVNNGHFSKVLVIWESQSLSLGSLECFLKINE
jgi:hypothetical protein